MSSTDPDGTEPTPAEMAGMIWRAMLIGAAAVAGWGTLSAARSGDLAETLATATVAFIAVGVLLASAIVARGRRER